MMRIIRIKYKIYLVNEVKSEVQYYCNILNLSKEFNLLSLFDMK
jgi:hypothetical protein